MRKTCIRSLSFLAVLVLLLVCPDHSRGAYAQEVGLPDIVQTQVPSPLKEIGSGVYRKFGFSIYRASLWSGGSVWDAGKPFALELRYMHGLSKSTLVDTVMDDIKEQNIADEETMSRWGKILDEALPAVEDGDTIIGVAVSKRLSLLFYNGSKIATITEPALSQAFFNIWLGQGANEDLRRKLLRQTEYTAE